MQTTASDKPPPSIVASTRASARALAQSRCAPAAAIDQVEAIGGRLDSSSPLPAIDALRRRRCMSSNDTPLRVVVATTAAAAAEREKITSVVVAGRSRKACAPLLPRCGGEQRRAAAGGGGVGERARGQGGDGRRAVDGWVVVAAGVVGVADGSQKGSETQNRRRWRFFVRPRARVLAAAVRRARRRRRSSSSLIACASNAGKRARARKRPTNRPSGRAARPSARSLTVGLHVRFQMMMMTVKRTHLIVSSAE